MRVVIFGASGMIGHGALRACLLDDTVTEVLAVVRSPLRVDHPKLRQITHTDFTDFSPIQDQFTDLDACFYCLGVSAVGHTEDAYTRITLDYTLAAARTLYAASPAITFLYVSGEGADPTGTSRQMWARVKGRTENELGAMEMKAHMFRPGYIQPVDGAVSRTTLYRVVYRITGVLYPILRRVVPRYVTTTRSVGRAMLAVARADGAAPTLLRNGDINDFALGHPPARPTAS
ncbi:epimerase [Streptomyces pseudovenezuelae]|uniref:NAD-dependent epimerase/dehydratase family protein n=1 Tax=Streptomyces pseudovenezuelae TaxID=67350 RepID=UPI002E34E7A3|nr:NAD-dependent epimerase/dehydratase family protein [Streptomyces pseudovenezuelae]